MLFTFTLSLPLVAQGLYYVLLFFFTTYGIFLAYHWFTFGTEKHTSTIALAVYLSGGAVLFLTLAASLHLIT